MKPDSLDAPDAEERDRQLEGFDPRHAHVGAKNAFVPLRRSTKRSLRLGATRDDEHRSVGPVDDRARDRAEQRPRDETESARADDDQRRVPRLREFDDPFGGASFEDLRVGVDAFVPGERRRAVERVARMGQLLAQLLLIVGLPERANRRPDVDEDGARANRPRRACPLGNRRGQRRWSRR